MKVNVVENDKGKLKLEVGDLTLVNLLNEVIWQKNPKLSAYAKEHPYLSDPVLLVKATDPKKTVISAANQIVKDISSLKKQVSKG